MKRTFSLLFIFIIIPSFSFSQEYVGNPSKFRSIRVGMDVLNTKSILPGTAFGPTVGIAFENWMRHRDGFCTEIMIGFAEGLNNKNERFIKNIVSLTIPLQWTHRFNEHLGFKTGSQLKILIVSPFNDPVDEFSGKPIKTKFLMDAQLPITFTYYATNRTYIDFKVSIPILPVTDDSTLACNTSFEIILGWSFIKK